MSIAILRADSSHAAAIATIGRRSFRQAFEEFFNSQEDLFEYLGQTYDPVKLTISLRKANNVFLLARIKGEPAGFAKVKKQSRNKHIVASAQMELQKLYVLPHYQKRGVGSALLAEVKRLADEVKADYVWLDTPVTNEKAIRLYEKNGFKKTGKHFFTIGSQTFEYHVMGLPVTVKELPAINS